VVGLVWGGGWVSLGWVVGVRVGVGVGGWVLGVGRVWLFGMGRLGFWGELED
jgi:hypothetical protein